MVDAKVGNYEKSTLGPWIRIPVFLRITPSDGGQEVMGTRLYPLLSRKADRQVNREGGHTGIGRWDCDHPSKYPYFPSAILSQ